MKYKFCIYLIFSLSVSLFGQTNKQKDFQDKSCTSLKEAEYIYNKDLPITDKELTEYIATNYSKTFPHVAIDLNIVLTSNQSPCCRRVVISDTTKMNQKEVESLVAIITKFPKLKKIKLSKDKPKYITLIVSTDKASKTTAVFLPAFD